MDAARDAWRRIGELFVQKSLITGMELEQALAVQAASGRQLGEVLVSQGLIPSPEMTEVILEQVGRKVAREEGFGSDLWSEVRRRTAQLRERRLTAKADSAGELNQRFSQLARQLTDAQLALDRERVAHESARAEAAATKDELAAAERRIGELAAIVDRLQSEPDERSQASAKWRRAVKRTLFGAELHLAQE